MWFRDLDDGPQIIFALLIGLAIGGVCGAPPLVLGLLRGHRSMAFAGFGFCLVLGIGCYVAALLPAIIFTIIVLATEPIEKTRKKKRRRGPQRRRRRMDRADDFVDDGDEVEERRRERQMKEDEDRRRRRRHYWDDDSDY